jgi:uncharacterized membrane protein YedE/YeeE
MELLLSPWPWYVVGPLITLVMFLMLYFGKKFGLSSSLRTVCAIGGAGKVVDFFDFEWKAEVWNLIFITGTIIGGFIASNYLSDGAPVELGEDTLAFLASIGLDQPTNELVPTALFNWETLLTTKGLIMMVLGGFLIGFGARYAGGCTSGHAISGLSNLQLPSLIAVIGFFIGGIITTYLLLPYILG